MIIKYLNDLNHVTIAYFESSDEEHDSNDNFLTFPKVYAITNIQNIQSFLEILNRALITNFKTFK